MTYQELLEELQQMTPDQLANTVHAYSGDIDEAIRVLGTSENSPADMGIPMPNFSTTQIFLILE